MEAPEPRAGIHQEIKENPVRGIEDFFLCEICAVALVDRPHDLFGDPLEDLGASVIVVNHPRCGLGISVNNETALCLLDIDAEQFALVMVESEPDPVVEGKVRGDVICRDVDFSVLDVLGVYEFDLVDDVKLLQEHGADEAVKITSGDQALLCRCGIVRAFHGCTSGLIII